MDSNKINNTSSRLPSPSPSPSERKYHFTESNAGHISVQTASPFRMRGSEFTTDQTFSSKNDWGSDMYSRKIPKDACSSTTSKLLVKQIITNNNLDGEGLNLEEACTKKNIRNVEKKSNYSQSFIVNNIEIKHSTPTFSSKYSSMQLGLCSREESIVPAAIAQHVSSERHIYESKSDNQKKYVEKTTYCRPVLSFNRELLNRTSEKNIRLQRLVTKLILDRKREKETEAWNNYINLLKNRHGYYDSEPHRLPQHYDKSHADFIDDYYAQSSLKHSNPCNELLADFYEACDTESPPSSSYCKSHEYELAPKYFENHSECYPMSSQGRLMMLNKERKRNANGQDWQYRPSARPFYGNTIIVDREYKNQKHVIPETCYKKNPIGNNKVEKKTCSVCDECNKCQLPLNFATQTSIAAMTSDKESETKQEDTYTKNTYSSFQEEYNKVSRNVDRLKKRFQKTVNKDGQSVLRSIEAKLDILITSLNSFMEEVKSRTNLKQCYNCQSVSYNNIRKFNRKAINISKSDSFGLAEAEKLVCGGLRQKYIKPIPYTFRNEERANNCRERNIDKIFIEEIDKSCKVKEDIENMLAGNTLRPSAVQISLDIPTIERSTEVPDSLSKAILRMQERSVSTKEIPINEVGENRRMTIAVNTDPLGLLALLRVSTESAKQLLSYVPNIPYHSYLSMIQFPQTNVGSHFVCNICGAAFTRPSQLSDHIRAHDLGKTRDCCVCRHVLDMQSLRPLGLFRCQYCGQRFTRAYCCELHQESCAKRFGLEHDASSSLMLLT